VPPDHWARDEIAACAEHDIVAGYSDGFYQPTWTVSRDQMAVYISRAVQDGAAIPTGPAEPTFGDVPADYWAYSAVEYAVAESIVEGYGDGDYHPDWQVTRAQMAVFIARALCGGEENVPSLPDVLVPFADVPVGYWADRHIYYLAGHHVALGYPDGYYYPAWSVSRDQMAVFIARAFELLL